MYDTQVAISRYVWYTTGMKYVKPIALVILGMVLMFIFSNATVRITHLNQHAITTTATGSEEIFTHRTGIDIEPTAEFHPLEIFGEEKPKE